MMNKDGTDPMRKMLLDQKIPAPMLRQAVSQVVFFLTGSSPVRAKEVADLIVEHRLLPDGWTPNPRRVYHVLNNGRRTRYQRTSGGFRWRPEAETPPPIEREHHALREAIRNLKEDPFENLVGGLLQACGLTDIRFTGPLSRGADGGIDLRAVLRLPILSPMEVVVQVSGEPLKRKKLNDLRGRCRRNETAWLVGHTASAVVREAGLDPAYAVQVRCFTAGQIAAEMERRGLTLDGLLAAGQRLRTRQFGGG